MTTEWEYIAQDQAESPYWSQMAQSSLNIWINEWYETDYSWESIAKIKWRAPKMDESNGFDDLTYQDYWRRLTAFECEIILEKISSKALDFDFPKSLRSKKQKLKFLSEIDATDDLLRSFKLLVQFEDKEWHISHLPIFDRNKKMIDFSNLSNFWLECEINTRVFSERLKLGFLPDANDLGLEDINNVDSLAQFMGCQFREEFGRNHIDNLTIYAKFKDALFLGFVNLANSQIGEFSTFQNAYFCDELDLSGATMKGCDFFRSVFSRSANFVETNFLSDAEFTEAQFLSFATFTDSIFSHAALFDYCIFCQYAEFSNTFFNNSLICINSIFAEDADFSCPAAALIADGDIKRTLHQTLFTNSVFLQKANFDNRLFTEELDFSNACFFERAQFYNCTFHPNVTFTPQRFFGLDPQIGAAIVSNHDIFEECAKQENPTKPTPSGFSELTLYQIQQSKSKLPSQGWYGNLEQDYRNLKNFMGRLSATTERQDFHALEISARLKRSDNAVTFFEKAIGHFYRISSDYARQPSRPLIGMLLVFLFSLFINGLLMNQHQSSKGTCLFGFSDSNCEYVLLPESGSQEAKIWNELIADNAQRTLFPFLRLKDDFPLNKELTQTYPISSTMLRLVQATLSVVLIFLFLLTIRRRFQMS